MRAEPGPNPRHLTPAERQAQVIDLLARALTRLHQRGLLHNPPTPQPRLDLSAEMPLSVGNHHPG